MKNSDWASVIAALGLGSVGFWFWRKSRQIEAQTAKTKQEHAPSPQASTAQPKVVPKVSQSAIQTVVKELSKPKVVKAAKLDSDIIASMLKRAVRDEKHVGTLGALVQWGTIIAVIQEQMREASFGSNWARGVLEFASEARAGVSPGKAGIATFVRDTGWTTSLYDDIDGWPLAPGPAGRCAFPMVGSDIDRIGSTPFLTEDGYVPPGDGWKMVPGPFEARYPIHDAMTSKCLFAEGNIVNEKMDTEDVYAKLADTAWGKSFRYNAYKEHTSHIGLAMPPVPSDCKTKAQIEHWILANGGFTTKALSDYASKVLKDPTWWSKGKTPLPLWTVPNVKNKMSKEWISWYNKFGRAMRLSRNLIQAAESWRVTDYQRRLLKNIKWKAGSEKLIYEVNKSLAPSTPSWWVEHCLAWGCGCATNDRMRSHWTPALGFRWYEGKKRGGWKTAPPVYPDPKIDVEDLLKYVMKLTPKPGSKWINHKEPLGRTIDVNGWVGWNWPVTAGSLYPHYRQTRDVIESTQKRYKEWREQEFPGPMSDKERALKAFKIVSEAISTIVSIYAGGVSAITMTMTNMMVENVSGMLADAFGGGKVALTLLGIAQSVAGFATGSGQGFLNDPAKTLKAAFYSIEQGEDPRGLLQSAVSTVSNWSTADGWDYGAELIGKVTDVPKQYRDVLKGML